MGPESSGICNVLSQRLGTVVFVYPVIALVLLLGMSAWSQSSNTPPAPAAIFQEGAQALQAGNLTGAEARFLEVIKLNPQSAAAWSNLGVVYMRQRKWDKALRNLSEARKLAPQIAGIRLDIGLVHFRTSDYEAARAPLSSVLRDRPDSVQARFLLALCDFFTGRFREAAQTLEPIWDSESGNINYLYVLTISAEKSDQKDLYDRALKQLMKTGQNTPEMHLLMGKAYLLRLDGDKAMEELDKARQANPRLPFVHYYRAMVYKMRGDLNQARDELLRDIALEPDIAYSYDQLGQIYYAQQEFAEAQKAFRDALQRDHRVADAYYGLAKILRQQKDYAGALRQLNEAQRLAPESASVHYMKGQVLLRLGRRQKAKEELAQATALNLNGPPGAKEELEMDGVKDPQLASQ
jgi:tetratricopeptide (TPR) repeat protein